MAEVFSPYHVFINHRGPDVKRTLASQIYHVLEMHGLRVFLDKQELKVGDFLTPAIQSPISTASVQIAIFSKTYAESSWCLDELVWMLDSHSNTKIIPIFYDIEPSALRHVENGAYATAFEQHRRKGRVTDERLKNWINALEKVSTISGVVFRTEIDDHGERLKEIVEIVLEKVGREPLHVCEHPVGLHQAAEHFEKEVLSQSESRDTRVVGIVGLGGSGKSTLATHLYNSKCSQFQRSCFLSGVSKEKIPSLQETLLRDLVRDKTSRIEDTRRGRTLLRDRLQGLKCVLIVFDDIDNREQIDNLLFVKDVVGNGSLILVTSRDQALLERSKIKIYNVKLLEDKHAQELFCLYAFADVKPLHDLQDMVKESVKICGGFPMALKVLARQLYNEHDPRKWKQQLESLRKQLPEDLLRQMVMDSYESLDIREKEAILDVAHFLIGEDTDLVRWVLDELNGDALQTLSHKCLLEFESTDIIRRRALRGAGVNWSTALRGGRKGSFKIRMHDLVRDMARQIGRQELPLRLCCSSDYLISERVFGYHGSVQSYNVRGIRRDEDHQFPVFLQNQDIGGLKLLAVQYSTILQKFKSVSGDLTWLRLGQFEDTLNVSPFLRNSLSNLIPSTLFLKSLRVLEVHSVSPQDFRNLFDYHEAPSQLCALEITCTKDYGSLSTAGPSTAVSTKHGSASKTSYSSQAPINLGPWFQWWLGKLNFKNLVKIILQNIPGLKTLPIKFEEVSNLRHVDLSGCSNLEALPDSFTEELLQLQYLALRDCSQLVLQDLGKISRLEYLDFQGCSLLQELPKGTEIQKFLKHLNVVHTALRELPEHLEQLENLEELQIGSSELTVIPSSLYNLCGLTDLTLIGCTNLQFIDNSIENLVHLESFRLYKCGVKALPETIAWTNIKILDVRECPLYSKELLTGAHSGNTPLDSSQAQGRIGQGAHPNRSGCLTDLIIRDSNILEIDIPQAESPFPELQTLDLSGNRSLTKIGSLPGNLVSLNLTNCSKLKALACLSNLARLEVLDISGCNELEILNVKALSSIKVIKGNGCHRLRNVQGLELLRKLSYLQISFRRRHISIWTFQVIRLPVSLSNVVVLEQFNSFREASVEVKRCHFTNEKLEGAILLFLVTHSNCKIEVAFLDHACTSDTYMFRDSPMFRGFSVHILMWKKDSDVFNDFKFSNDEAIRFNINVPEKRRRRGIPPAYIESGWILETEDVLQMSSFLAEVFRR